MGNVYWFISMRIPGSGLKIYCAKSPIKSEFGKSNNFKIKTLLTRVFLALKQAFSQVAT